MSTHTDSSPPNSGAGRKRIKPHQLVIGIGCFMGLFTLVSGILPQITNWHDPKSPSREVLGGIPGALQVAFYTVIPVMLVWGAIVFADRVRNWERGAPDRRRTTPKNVKRRLADFRAGVYMRTLLRDSAAGLMHSMIYFGFLAPARCHHRARGRPPAARERQVPPRHDVPGLLDVRRSRRPGVRRRHRVGDRSSLRAAPLSHPNQDQARARRDPRHVLR